MLTFEKVYTHDNLRAAARRVATKKKSAGIDGMKAEEAIKFFSKKFKRDIVIKKLRKGTYTTHKSMIVPIKKDNGKKRILKVQTIIDRVVLDCLASALSYEFRNVFSDSIYAYRQFIGAHHAVKNMKKFYLDGYEYAVKLDLKSYFDRIPHKELFEKLDGHIDEDLKAVINMFIRSKSNKSIQQGSPISPFLANFYLCDFDEFMNQFESVKYLRYADDLLIMSKEPMKNDFVDRIIARLKEEKVAVNPDKTVVGHMSEVSFLGFQIKDNYLIVPKKRMDKFENKIDTIINHGIRSNTDIMFKKLNQYTQGWISYYRLANLEVTLFKVQNRINDKIEELLINKKEGYPETSLNNIIEQYYQSR